jgi:hypothetical protein
MVKKILPISVVIPTLGGNHLTQTIKKLNENEFIPSEILICIPEEYIKLNDFVLSENARLVPIVEKGQVLQRAIGFKNTTQNFVLQLDDDVELSSKSLKLLYDKLLELGPNNVVAPIWFDSFTNNAVHKYKNGLRGFIDNIIVFTILGGPWGKKKMGVISKSGVNYGVEKEFMKDELLNVEWVPGGCVMYYKQNVCYENYYPLKGKAYSEDLIHSFLLRKKGVKLYIIKDAAAYTPIPFSLFNKKEFESKYNALRYSNQLQNKSMFRLYIWGLISKLRKA